MEIVLNEYEWIESMVKNLSIGTRPRVTLKRYALLLRSRGYDKASIKRTLEDYILRCCSDANLYQWSNIVDQAVRECDSRQLYKIDYISITKRELDTIASIEGIARQKVMFTLLCIAKYRNIVNKTNNNWVSCDMTDVFKLANVERSKKRQMLIIHELSKLGMIGFSKVVDNTNVQVKYVYDDDDVALRVSDFRNLGNQYLRLTSDGFIECSECGLVIRQNNSKHKLCSGCAKSVNRIQARERYYNHVA